MIRTTDNRIRLAVLAVFIGGIATGEVDHGWPVDVAICLVTLTLGYALLGYGPRRIKRAES